jgi:hypothetical protein
MFIAKDKYCNDIAVQVGDEFTNLNNGAKNQPFNGKVLEVLTDRLKVIGGGYIGGAIYKTCNCDVFGVEHMTITSRNSATTNKLIEIENSMDKVKPVPRALVAKIMKLTKGVVVDVDGPLPAED